MARYAVELAYSRLGIKGVYNQDYRLTKGYYTDCAALVSWCYSQVGLDISRKGSTVSALADYADSFSKNKGVWVWKAEIDTEAIYDEIDSYIEHFPKCRCKDCTPVKETVSHKITFNKCNNQFYRFGHASTCDGHCGKYTETVTTTYWWYECCKNKDECICDDVLQAEDIVFHNDEESEITADQLVKYNDVLTEQDIDTLIQPGDIVFFDWKLDALYTQYEDLEYDTDCPQNSGDISTDHAFQGYRLVERNKEGNALTYGYNHVGIVVGSGTETGKHGETSRYLLVVEASSTKGWVRQSK